MPVHIPISASVTTGLTRPASGEAECEHLANKMLAPNRAGRVSGGMQIDRDRLILMALAALDDLIDQAKDRTIEPTLSVRVLLAATYALSDGRRDPYDDFWRQMQNPWSSQASAQMSSHCRTSYMRTNL